MRVCQFRQFRLPSTSVGAISHHDLNISVCQGFFSYQLLATSGWWLEKS
ncbi:hypothetical protein [Scytonema millei]|uniref:Uncharacterized protein n=1 Tax=Scytonema millei VB511283 TaxID=1245923 RepID=A0A9X5EAP8_9CYAN|nr:hypothetical protein [Scytonema millei]NHC38332.1 hypothetical protein [Scytonema millei VB511283]